MATIAFEASGPTVESYPIEIGVCVWRSPSSRPAVWSTLIRPDPRSAAQDDWDRADKDALEIGMPDPLAGVESARAVSLVNDRLRGVDFAWCNGGARDVHWMKTLARASGVRPLWFLGHVGILTAAWPAEAQGRVATYLDGSAPVHRAAPDAERLMRAFAAALELKFPDGVEHFGGADRDA